MLFKMVNSLFLLAYMLSALVQYNDPDALAWIAIYLASAGMCIAWMAGLGLKWLSPLLLLISVVWAGTLLPNIIGQVSTAEVLESISMRTREVEEAREIGGLVLVALWAGVLTVLSFRKP